MFNKDILLIDMEATGLDARKHDMIQIGALLLDKKTLKEKKSYVSYIQPASWDQRDPEAMEVNQISYEQLKKAPRLKSVLAKLLKIADPQKIILAYYAGILDIEFLRNSFHKVNKKFPYDYHYFNIWGLFYSYAAHHRLLKNKKQYAGFGLEDLMKHFQIPTTEEALHDALVDCQVEAEILRRIIHEYKPTHT